MVKARIESLRKLFQEFSIDGYIIPTNDKYMNEYVPEHAKRLEYITGFTGSNGIAIITNNIALFFTDGRYITQANMELDPLLFKIFDLKNIKLFKWENYIQQNITTIGYDIELFTYPVITQLFYNFPYNLQKIKGNLIDQIWSPRPLKPNSKIYLHDIQFTGQSHVEKIYKCRQKIPKDYALIILDSTSICWMLNLRANDIEYTPLMLAKMIVTLEQVYLFVEHSKINEELRKSRPEITILPEDAFESILRKMPNVLADEHNLSVYIMDLIKDKNIQKVSNPCAILKACKNDVEIKHAINFHIQDAVVLCEFLSELNVSKNLAELTEYDLAMKLTSLRSQQAGYVCDSFPTICGFQENSAIIHYKPDKKHAKKITTGGILLIDSGAQYYGCTTDITRTISIGSPTIEQKKYYTLVLKGHIALAQIKFPKFSISGRNLDVLARQYLWREAQDYPHGTGHGVGSFLSVHEGPQGINLRNDTILQPSMILSNEPGIYFSGKYGIRIENLLYITENNGWLEFINLSLVPYSIDLIEYSMLNKQELEYLKNYYQDIKNKIYLLLSKNAQLWLEKQINLFL